MTVTSFSQGVSDALGSFRGDLSKNERYKLEVFYLSSSKPSTILDKPLEQGVLCEVRKPFLSTNCHATQQVELHWNYESVNLLFIV